MLHSAFSRTIIGTVFILATALLPFVSASASPSETESFLKSIQKTYASMNSFSASFKQTLKHAEAGTTEDRSGNLIFQKPLRVRWETQEPNAELLVVTDTDVWNYFPDEAVVYKNPVSTIQDSRNMISVITGQSSLDKDFTVEPEADADGCKTFRLYPKEPTPNMTEVQILVDPKTFLLKRVAITDFYNNINTILFESIKTGASPKPDDFSFTPPPGTTIEMTSREPGQGTSGKTSQSKHSQRR